MKYRKVCVLVAVLLLFLSLALPWLEVTSFIEIQAGHYKFIDYYFPFWTISYGTGLLFTGTYISPFGFLWMGLVFGIETLFLWVIFHLFSSLIGIVAFFKNKWVIPTIGLTCLSLVFFLIGISQFLTRFTIEPGGFSEYYVGIPYSSYPQISYGFFCSCLGLILFIISLIVKKPTISITAPTLTVPTSKKFCIYCGAEIPPIAIFCPKCGKKQDSG
jgi:hypothetical protein